MSFTPGELLRHVSGKVRDRARDLVGEVGRRERQGNVLRARVQGSRPAPYRVRINLETGEVACSCPDEYNAICKHAAATLLVLVDEPDSFVPAASPRRLPTLTGFAEGDVERLLDRLHDLYPDTVLDWARELTHAAEEEGWE